MNTQAISFDQVLDALAEAVSRRLEPLVEGKREIKPRLLTVQQAATYMACSKASVYHQVAEGKLPVVRRDRRVFLDVRDIDGMIEACKQNGAE